MNGGWIKLYRQLQDCCIWTKNEPYDVRSAWIDLLLSATHKDKAVLVNNKTEIIKSGSFATSTIKLSKRWQWSRAKTIRYLSVLEREQMINTKRTPHGTLVTIVNYEKFQQPVQAVDTTVDTTVDTQNKNIRIKELKNKDNIYNNIYNINNNTNDKHIVNNNHKNIINKKECGQKRTVFYPPTLSDVKNYCDERNNNINPQAFIDFYESKGWMIGKNKMKNWKAAVRTWERKDEDGRKTNTGTKRDEIPWDKLLTNEYV